jgi:hypothetical protein
LGHPIDLAAEEGEPAEDGSELAHDLEDERLGEGRAEGLDPEFAGERDTKPTLIENDGVSMEGKVENELGDD